MATLVLHPCSPGPSRGILLNATPAPSPAYHPACLPALIPSNSSISSSSSSAPGDASDYFSQPFSNSPGPSHFSPALATPHLNPNFRPRHGSNARRIRFAPLPEPRRDDDGSVFIDDDTDDQPLTMHSALATAALSLAAPADAALSKRAQGITSAVSSSPSAARKSLPTDSPRLGLASPRISPESSSSAPAAAAEAQHGAVSSECTNDWEALPPPAPLPLSVPLPSPQPTNRRGKWSKVFKPLLGRSSPLVRTLSSEDLETMNANAHRGRSDSNGSLPPLSSSRDSSVTRERNPSDFGAPLHRWTSEGAPCAGLPVSKKKRMSLFGGGASTTNTVAGVPLGRTQSLTSLSSKEEKKAAKAKPTAVQAAGGRKGTRMLNGRVYGAKRKPNANPFANVRTDEPEFVEWGYGGMGSVKNTAGQSSVWSRLQADSNAAGIASKSGNDDDDGSGMAWVKRRKEERERKKREEEERAKKEQEDREKEATEASAENADVEMNSESEEGAPDPKDDDAERSDIALVDKAGEVESAPLSPTPAPSTPLASEAQKPNPFVEHVTQAVTIPAANRQRSHSLSRSHHHAHHHHAHSLSLSHVDTRGSDETAHQPVFPNATTPSNGPLLDPESETVERESVSSSGASQMSTTSEDTDGDESPKEIDGGFGCDEDSEEDDLEQQQSRLTARSAGVEKIARHNKEDQSHSQSATSAGTPVEASS